MKAAQHHRLFFFLLLLFLPSQLNIYFWPEWSYVLGRKIDILSPAFYATDLFLITTLCLWFFSLYKKIRIKTVLVTLTTITVLIAVNTQTSILPIATLVSWTRMLPYVLLGVYVSSTKPPLYSVAVALLFGSLVPVVGGLGQVLQQQSLGGVWYFLGERSFFAETPGIANAVFCSEQLLGGGCFSSLRAYATFPHPNVFAGYLLLVFMTALCARREKHDKQPFFAQKPETEEETTFFLTMQNLYARVTHPMVLVPLFGVFSVALLFTVSRSALLGLLVGLLWYFFVINRERFYKGIILLFILVNLFYIVSVVLGGNIVNALEIRRELLVSAWQMFQDYAFFGVGLDQFIRLLPEYISNRSLYILQPVHNIYMLYLVETGVFGVLVTTFLGYHLYRTQRLVVNSVTTPILVAFLIVGFFDHYLLTLHQGLIVFAVAAGLVFKKSAILKR